MGTGRGQWICTRLHTANSRENAVGGHATDFSKLMEGRMTSARVNTYIGMGKYKQIYDVSLWECLYVDGKFIYTYKYVIVYAMHDSNIGCQEKNEYMCIGICNTCKKERMD